MLTAPTGYCQLVCFSRVLFSDYSKILVKWYQWMLGPGIVVSVSICSGLVMEYWPNVGTCGFHEHSQLRMSFLPFGFFFSLAVVTIHPNSHPSYSPCWPKLSKAIKIEHYLFARLVVITKYCSADQY